MESRVSKNRKKEKSTVIGQCEDLPLWHPPNAPSPMRKPLRRSQRGRRREISSALVSVRKKWDHYVTDKAAKEMNFRARKKSLERDVPLAFYSPFETPFLILFSQLFFSFSFFLKKGIGCRSRMPPGDRYKRPSLPTQQMSLRRFLSGSECGHNDAPANAGK